MAITGILLFAGVLGARAASVPSPTVSGPIASPDIPGTLTHNYPFFASNHNLAEQGYVEEEYYFQGTANTYNTPALTTGTITSSGNPYLTRMLVRRPADPKKFNGTVLVEWLNVTNGFDADNEWFFSWEHILAAGYAWVGVSAQEVGVASWAPPITVFFWRRRVGSRSRLTDRVIGAMRARVASVPPRISAELVAQVEAVW